MESNPSQEPGSRPAPRTRRVLGRRPTFETLALLIPLAFMVLAYGVPLAMTLARSLTDPSLGLGNFAHVFTEPTLRRALWTTVRITLEVTACSTVLGFIAALYLSRQTARRARLLSLIVIIPLWTSVLVRSFAWIVVLGSGGPVERLVRTFNPGAESLLYTEAAVVIAMTHVLLPYMVLTCKGTLDQIDPALVRAARTLGAGPFRAWTKVYLPLAVPGIVSGAVLVAVMSFGFYITPALVGGPSQSMISTLISQQINVTFEWGLAAALATILVTLTAAMYAVVRRFTKISGLVGQP